MTYSADFAIYADLRGSDFKALSNNNQAGPLSRYTITQKDDIPDWAYYYFYKAIANVNKALAAADALVVAEEDEATFNEREYSLQAITSFASFNAASLFP